MQIEIIILLLSVAFLAACILLRFDFFSVGKLNWLPLGCVGVVLIGSVLGRDFFHLSLGPLPLTLDRLLLGVLWLIFGWQAIFNRQQFTRINYVDLAILMWLAMITFSTFTHDFTIMENGPLSRLLFFNYVPVLLYFLTRWVRFEAADLKVISLMLVGFGVYLAFTAIAETRGLPGLVFPKYIMNAEEREFLGRGRGPFLNPVSNGIFMAVCICSALMWWPRVKSSRGKFLVLALVLFISIGVYSTYTRSTWLSLVLGMGVFVFWPSKAYQKGIMIVTATLLAIALFPVVGDKIYSFKRDEDVTLAEMEKSALLRPLFVEIAWEMVQDRPVLGVGFAQYPKAKYPYLQNPHTTEALRDTRGLMQHNVFLAYVVDMGFVGLVTLVGLLGAFLTACWQVWRNRSLDLWARQFALANIVLLVGYCVNGMFHDVSIVPLMHMLLFFWIGVVSNVLSGPEAFQKKVNSVVPESLVLERPQRIAA